MPLTYSYTVVGVEKDGSETSMSPKWIEFDANPNSPTFRTFTFSPHKSWYVGTYKVRVRARDKGIGGVLSTKESASVDIMLEVIEVNDRPEGQTLVDQTVTEDTPKTYPFPVFTDEETSALTYETEWAVRDSAGEDIKDADGQKTFVPHAKWIQFGAVDGDATKMQFAFKPHKSWHAEKHTLRVTADDGQKGTTSQEFILLVSEFNDVAVASSLVDQTVEENTEVFYPFPDRELCAGQAGREPDLSGGHGGAGIGAGQVSQTDPRAQPAA